MKNTVDLAKERNLVHSINTGSLRPLWVCVILFRLPIGTTLLLYQRMISIAERFGTKLRYSGASLGYQLASVTAGGPAPIIATALVAGSKALIGAGPPSYTLIAFYIIFMGLVSFVSTALLRRDYAGKPAAEDVPEPEVAASAT